MGFPKTSREGEALVPYSATSAQELIVNSIGRSRPDHVPIQRIARFTDEQVMGELGVPTTFHERSGAWRIRGAIRVVGLCLFTLYLVRGPTGIEATVDQLRGLPPAIWLLACGSNLIPP
jgi:hypothetical protein